MQGVWTRWIEGGSEGEEGVDLPKVCLRLTFRKNGSGFCATGVAEYALISSGGLQCQHVLESLDGTSDTNFQVHSYALYCVFLMKDQKICVCA